MRLPDVHSVSQCHIRCYIWAAAELHCALQDCWWIGCKAQIGGCDRRDSSERSRTDKACPPYKMLVRGMALRKGEDLADCLALLSKRKQGENGKCLP